MALLEVTNESARVLNRLEEGGNGVSPDAVGGNVLDPLPFPFNANGSLAVGASRELPVHGRDFNVRQQMQQPMLPADEWNQMVQAGLVSLSFTYDARSLDPEDMLAHALGD